MYPVMRHCYIAVPCLMGVGRCSGLPPPQCWQLGASRRAGCCWHARHCVRVAKEMDSKSIGLWPQGFESPRCRIGKLVGKWHNCMYACALRFNLQVVEEQFGRGCCVRNDSSFSVARHPNSAAGARARIFRMTGGTTGQYTTADGWVWPT